MKFKDTIYSKKKLSHELLHPTTGEVLIPAHRWLTKFLLIRATEAGLIITADMFDDHLKSRAQNKKVKINERIKFLRDKIPAYEAELLKLEDTLSTLNEI